MTNKVSTIVMFHNDLPMANKVFLSGETSNIIPESVNTLIALDSNGQETVKTVLDRTKKGFLGKPVISSLLLKGMDKINTPTIFVPKETEGTVILTYHVGNRSFTQRYSKNAVDSESNSRLFGYNLVNTLLKRVELTYKKFQDNTVDIGYFLTPYKLNRFLTDGYLNVQNENGRRTYYRPVTVTTNQHIMKLKGAGLIIKRTKEWYNKERKEHVDYLVISASGLIRIFEGENSTFEKPIETGYVLLADLPKVSKA